MADKRYDQQAAQQAAAAAAAQGAAQAKAQAQAQAMLKNANAATQNVNTEQEPLSIASPIQGIGTAASTDGSDVGANPYKNPGEYKGTAEYKDNGPYEDKGPYQESEAVAAARTALDQIEAQKPQSFDSKYGTQLDSILDQIMNPEKFKYDFNGDELFKYYADLYSQNGRQASMDAIGQASALTGGYGNSYAEQVGNQAYDEWMRSLYDKGLDLRDRAYQQYRDDQSNQYNMYNTLSNADERDYGRYRDALADWLNERGYYTDLLNNERNFDYGQYTDQRNFDYNVFNDQRNFDYDKYINDRNFDYNVFNDQRNYDYGVFSDQRSFDEQVRQFNENMDWDKMSTQQKYAYDTAMAMLQYGVMPTEDMLLQAGISSADAKGLFNAIQAQLLMQQGGGTGGGGGGGGGGRTKNSSSGDPYTYYTDEKGNYYTFDKKGNAYTVDPKLVNDDDIIDTSLANFSYNLRNMVNDASKTATDQWNTSQTVNALGNALGSVKDTVGNALGSIFGKQDKKKK